MVPFQINPVDHLLSDAGSFQPNGFVRIVYPALLFLGDFSKKVGQRLVAFPADPASMEIPSFYIGQFPVTLYLSKTVPEEEKMRINSR